MVWLLLKVVQPLLNMFMRNFWDPVFMCYYYRGLIISGKRLTTNLNKQAGNKLILGSVCYLYFVLVFFQASLS